MKCPFCGREYTEENARKDCTACSLFGGCKNWKCPYCGYETPQETSLVRWLRRKKEKQS